MTISTVGGTLSAVAGTLNQDQTPPDPSTATVTNLWAGGVQDTSMVLNTRLSNEDYTSARFVVSTSPSLTSPVYSTSTTSASVGLAGWQKTVTGLAPDTEYYYGVEVDGVVDSKQGRFKTAPPVGQPASFTTLFASCSFPTTAVRTRYAETGALMFVHLGDFSYGDQASTDIAVWRSQYAAIVNTDWYPDIASDWTWSDHDFGVAGAAIANQAYREILPHYPLPSSTAIYHAYTIGRVRFLVMDMFSEQVTDGDINLRTRFGAAQMAWFADECAAAGADPDIALIVAYSAELNTFVNDLDDMEAALLLSGMLGSFAYIHGDLHMLGIDDGTSPSGMSRGWPVFCAAPLQSGPADRGLIWSEGKVFGSSGQYGQMDVTDDGSTLTINWTGRNATTAVLSYSFGVSAPAFSATPTVTGTTETGQTLTAVYTATGSAPTTITRQWYTLPASNAGGTGDVLSATGTPVGLDQDTYAVPSGDAGLHVGVVVTAVNRLGTAVYSSPTVGPLTAGAAGPQMLGGTVVDADGYRTHTFTTSGTLEVVTAGEVEYLVVGGGGGGGTTGAGTAGSGGGGAGGVLFGTLNVTDDLAVLVGAGGAIEASGGDSSLGVITALGGGFGSSVNVSPAGSGGSGGGTGNSSTATTPGSGTSGQGFAGGAGRVGSGSTGGGGGGGGAGAVGAASPASNGGAGVTVYGLAVGGGGGGGSASLPAASLGGGGLGGLATVRAATAGTDGTGGGGGGFRGNTTDTGAPGGSGIVVVRYLL